MDPKSKTSVMRLGLALVAAYVLFRIVLNYVYPA